MFKRGTFCQVLFSFHGRTWSCDGVYESLSREDDDEFPLDCRARSSRGAANNRDGEEQKPRGIITIVHITTFLACCGFFAFGKGGFCPLIPGVGRSSAKDLYNHRHKKSKIKTNIFLTDPLPMTDPGRHDGLTYSSTDIHAGRCQLRRSRCVPVTGDCWSGAAI